MASPPYRILVLSCDYENIALDVCDAEYANVDITLVLERLLAEGSIAVQKACGDWGRYRNVKALMHEVCRRVERLPSKP